MTGINVGSLLIHRGKKWLVSGMDGEADVACMCMADVFDEWLNASMETLCYLGDYPDCVYWEGLWSDAIEACNDKKLKRKATKLLEEQDWEGLNELIPLDREHYIREALTDSYRENEIDWEVYGHNNIRMNAECLFLTELVSGEETEARFWMEGDEARLLIEDDTLVSDEVWAFGDDRSLDDVVVVS